MRTANDVFEDPQVGDVVRTGSKYRLVTIREDWDIRYVSHANSREQFCFLSTWQKWCRKHKPEAIPAKPERSKQ